MPLDQLPTPTPPETTTCPPASSATLHAVFIADERPAYLGLLTGARCVLPTGDVVEQRHKRTPFFAICRELDKRGYGDCRIEISTPQGTPSMRGKVSTLAGLSIEESDKDGLRLRTYRPFPPGRVAKERDLGPESTQRHRRTERRSSVNRPLAWRQRNFYTAFRCPLFT